MTHFPSTTPRTHSGAGGSAPSFSEIDEFVLRMEIAAAGRERDVMLEYERLQDERIAAVRESAMRALRVEMDRREQECKRANKAEKREARLRRALWAAATLAALETMALLWVVLR